jgi:hypothetical protein
MVVAAPLGHDALKIVIVAVPYALTQSVAHPLSRDPSPVRADQVVGQNSLTGFQVAVGMANVFEVYAHGVCHLRDFVKFLASFFIGLVLRCSRHTLRSILLRPSMLRTFCFRLSARLGFMAFSRNSLFTVPKNLSIVASQDSDGSDKGLMLSSAARSLLMSSALSLLGLDQALKVDVGPEGRARVSDPAPRAGAARSRLKGLGSNLADDVAE